MKFTIEGLDPDLKVLEGNVTRTGPYWEGILTSEILSASIFGDWVGAFRSQTWGHIARLSPAKWWGQFLFQVASNITG